MEGLKTLITGGDGGIGRAVAIAFAREGADVAITYINEHDDATAKYGEIMYSSTTPHSDRIDPGGKKIVGQFGANTV